MTLLARPVSSLNLFAGKALGLFMLSTSMTLSLMLVLIFIVTGFGLDLNFQFFLGFIGILFESFLLISLGLLLSTISKPVLAVSYGAAIFFVGHWLESLMYFAGKSQSEPFRLAAKVIKYIIPDLERFNWRDHFLYAELVPLNDLFYAAIYCLAWSCVLLIVASYIFKKRDLI